MITVKSWVTSWVDSPWTDAPDDVGEEPDEDDLLAKRFAADVNAGDPR